MKLSKINIAAGTVLRELLIKIATKTNSSLSIEELNDIVNKSESIISTNELMASVHFSVNNVEIDFDDIIIAFSDLFNEISQKLELDSKTDEINKKIELGVQDKLDNEYLEIFDSVRATHQLIEANRERIEHMYAPIEKPEPDTDIDTGYEGDHVDAGDANSETN